GEIFGTLRVTGAGTDGQPLDQVFNFEFVAFESKGETIIRLRLSKPFDGVCRDAEQFELTRRIAEAVNQGTEIPPETNLDLVTPSTP
ncbi:MAG: hypothetical protein ABI557_05870, partial [Aureliella sp.]